MLPLPSRYSKRFQGGKMSSTKQEVVHQNEADEQDGTTKKRALGVARQSKFLRRMTKRGLKRYCVWIPVGYESAVRVLAAEMVKDHEEKMHD
jgi:hypothetical protein